MEILPVENLGPKLLQGPENSQHEMSPEFFHIPMQHCFSLHVDHCVWILTISMKLWQDKGCPGIEGLSLLLRFSLTDYANLYCPHETETGYQAWLQKSSIFEENSFLSLAFVRLCETLNSPGNEHGPWGWTIFRKWRFSWVVHLCWGWCGSCCMWASQLLLSACLLVFERSSVWNLSFFLATCEDGSAYDIQILLELLNGQSLIALV